MTNNPREFDDVELGRSLPTNPNVLFPNTSTTTPASNPLPDEPENLPDPTVTEPETTPSPIDAQSPAVEPDVDTTSIEAPGAPPEPADDDNATHIEAPGAPPEPETSTETHDPTPHMPRGWEADLEASGEVPVNMTRRQFAWILGGAAAAAATVGIVAKEGVEMAWTYVTRDNTIEELADDSTIEKIGPRAVKVTVPSGLQLGTNSYVCARRAGTTSWEQITVEQGKWLMLGEEFPEGGDIEMTLCIIRDGKFVLLDKPSLGTVKSMAKTR